MPLNIKTCGYHELHPSSIRLRLLPPESLAKNCQEYREKINKRASKSRGNTVCTHSTGSRMQGYPFYKNVTEYCRNPVPMKKGNMKNTKHSHHKSFSKSKKKSKNLRAFIRNLQKKMQANPVRTFHVNIYSIYTHLPTNCDNQPTN